MLLIGMSDYYKNPFKGRIKLFRTELKRGLWRTQLSLLLWCQYILENKISTKFHYLHLQVPSTDFSVISYLDPLLKSDWQRERNGNLKLREISCQHPCALLFSSEISMLMPQMNHLRCRTLKATRKATGSEAWFWFGQ